MRNKLQKCFGYWFFGIWVLFVIWYLGIGISSSYALELIKKSSTKKEASTQDKIQYWTCAMHPSVRSDRPGKCPICGMNLIPVYQEKAAPKTSAQTKPTEAQTQASEEEHQYYGCGIKEEGHCPHCDKGIKDEKCICGGHSFLMEGDRLKTCPVCGKELKKIKPQEVPSQVDSKIAASRVRLNQTQLQLAGIKTQPLSYEKLTKEIRTVGRIAYDPELAVAQEEFLTALETREKVSQSPDADVIARAQDILDKSKFHLRHLGMSNEEIVQLEAEGKAQLNLVLPEEKVWVYANIYEYELSWISIGQDVIVRAIAYPGEEFKGVIKSISPILEPATRSAKVRIEVSNPEEKLKPEMYVDVFIKSKISAEREDGLVLVVPKEAVLDTGMRKIAYVDEGNATFIGKEVKLGPEAAVEKGGETIVFYPVLSGLNPDDRVVTKGNFLIDSQSQLTGGMSVLWGGATEIKEEAPAGGEKIETQHKH